MSEANSRDQHHEEEYSDALVDFLEVLWGEGYLSPGGAEEVARILDGVDLAGQRVLDIGCGSGGIALSLAADYGAAHVTGIDVEDTVLGKARARAAARGLEGRVEFRKVEPGPLLFPDDHFDVVFSRIPSSTSRIRQRCSPTSIASSSLAAGWRRATG